DYILQNLSYWRTSVELLPDKVLSQYEFVDLISALQYLHRPPPEADVELLLQGQHPMQKRLAFEEFIAQQLLMHQARLQIQNQKAWILPEADTLRDQFIKILDFKLTAAQERVVAEIDHDI